MVNRIEISCLDIPVRLCNIFHGANVYYLNEMCNFSKEQVETWLGVGKITMLEIMLLLKKNNISLRKDCNKSIGPTVSCKRGVKRKTRKPVVDAIEVCC